MARIILLALYYLLAAPVAYVAISWKFYAYQQAPNMTIIWALMMVVLLAPFAFLFFARRV